MQTSEYVFGPQERPLRTATLQPTDFLPVAEELCSPPEPIEHPDPRDFTVLALIELILKDRTKLYRLLRTRSVQSVLLPRLLAISLTGFVLFSLSMSLVLTVSGRWPALTTLAVWLKNPSGWPLSFAVLEGSRIAPWGNGQALTLVGAYAFGLVAASGVCLPSLYFYCLLAGVRLTMLDVVLHAVKSKAIAAVALVGILPIYIACALGVVIFGGGQALLEKTLLVGLLLPFIAGIWGTASLYEGFSQLCGTMPPNRAARRACFLRRLVLSWSACYTAVMPVMIYAIWEAFSRS